MRTFLGFKLEKRVQVNPLLEVTSIFLALLASFLICAGLIHAAGADVKEAFGALLAGAFGDKDAVLETLVKATPLIFTGLACTIAFRANFWNIGAEGQLYSGAMLAYLICSSFPNLPPALLIPLTLLGGVIGGGLLGWLVGWLKARLKVDEIIVTVLMNYIVTYLLSFLLSDVWRDPKSFYRFSSEISPNAMTPILVPDSRLHLGFALAILMAVAMWVLLKKTSLGYQIRALGQNPVAARFKGMNIARIIMVVMFISGGIAGLAGAGEMLGLHHRLRMDISSNYGYTGIIIALLARLNPLGVIIAAIFFGGLVTGVTRMQIVTNVPVALVYAIQGIVLLFVLAAEVLTRYQIRRVEDGK